MTRRFAPSTRRTRALFVLTALAAVLICLPAATWGSGGKAVASVDKNGPERFDGVLEGHPTGGLNASLATAAFPDRLVIVTMPHGGHLSGTRVTVLEDGKRVPGVTVQPLGSGARYGLGYVSEVPLGEREVELTVSIDGVGKVALDYAAPRSAPAGAGGNKHAAPRSAPAGQGDGRQSFWRSGSSAIVVPVVAGLLVALALIMWLVPRRRRSGLRRRVGEFTAQVLPAAVAPPETEEQARLPGLERLLTRMRWWPAFKRDVEIASFDRSAVELVAITAIATVVMAGLLGVAVGAVVVSVLILPLGPLALHSRVRHRLRKQRTLFADQLAQHLEEMASAMRAGHGFVAGLAAMVKSASEPSRREWARVLADEQLGMPLEVAMRSLAARMDSREIEQVSLVASLHRRTGGNIAEVLDRLADGVRDRAELRRELVALTAQARLSRWVVTLLPPGVLGVVELINPAYLTPLFNTPTGNIVLAIAVAMLVAGSFVMRTLTDIKV